MIRFKQSQCYFNIRPNAKMLCRVCNRNMQLGDPYVALWGSNAHRMCVKELVEWSLDMLPLTDREIATDPTGKLAEVEFERGRRAFAEYREKLLDRLGF